MRTQCLPGRFVRWEYIAVSYTHLADYDRKDREEIYRHGHAGIVHEHRHGVARTQEEMCIRDRDFDGRVAALSFEQLMQLEHAWAMTVHKSQGSEYRAVVLALAQACLLYTSRCV